MDNWTLECRQDYEEADYMAGCFENNGYRAMVLSGDRSFEIVSVTEKDVGELIEFFESHYRLRELQRTDVEEEEPFDLFYWGINGSREIEGANRRFGFCLNDSKNGSGTTVSVFRDESSFEHTYASSLREEITEVLPNLYDDLDEDTGEEKLVEFALTE